MVINKMVVPSFLQWWLVCMCLVSSFANCSPNEHASRLWRTMINSKRSQKPPAEGLYSSTTSLEENYFQVQAGRQDGLREADRISRLPGQPRVAFNQYSGYVNVDPTAGRAFFYYFVEASRDARKKPLVLWLNGGPGCSSLAYGAMKELGPFRVNSDGQTLFINPFAWNNVANVLFLESPASVGFSYSNTSADYTKLGDHQTAKDNFAFLVNWLERFPEYKSRGFFLSGESYAGHYVPQLADFILDQNKSKKYRLDVNFKGIAIGNPWIDDDTNQLGVFDYMLSHALISDEAYKNLTLHCLKDTSSISAQCRPYYEKAFYEEAGDINLYNIYAPTCHNSTRKEAHGSVARFDPCMDNYIDSYLNRPEVQKALHARPTSWTGCRDVNWTDWEASVLPTLKKLIANDLPVWIYSGDVDSNVPFTSSKYSIETLNLTKVEPWRPWYSRNEVGGYVIKYEGLSFVTVRGAGHEVPSYRPRAALTLLSTFLQGRSLPDTSSDH